MGFLLVLIIIAAIVAFKIFTSPKEKYVRSVSAGKSPEQIKTIRYFVDTLFGKYSDSEYEGYVNSLVQRDGTQQMALSKLGIDEDEVKEIEPIMMEGYLFDNSTYQKRVGNRWVSSGYEISWLFFSATQLYVYTKTFYMDETRDRENTLEYFYKDVTAFRTGSENVEVFDKVTNKRDNVSVTNFQVVVPGDDVKIAMRDASEFEGRIQGMKQLLREKKGQ